MRLAGNEARMNDRKGEHKILVWRPVRIGPLERHKRRWKDNNSNNNNNNSNMDT